MLDSLTENETGLILRSWTTMAPAFQIKDNPRFEIIEGDAELFDSWDAEYSETRGYAASSERDCFLWYSSPIEAIIAHKYVQSFFYTSVLIKDFEYSDRFLVMVPRAFANKHFSAQV